MRSPKLIKKYYGVIIISLILIGLYLFHKDSFFLIIWAYGLGLYLFVKLPVPMKVRKAVSIIIWFALAIACGLTYYSNHYLEKGSLVETGFNTCEFKDSGPCGNEVKEDTRNLNIPVWGKFFKDSGIHVVFAILFAAIIISGSMKKENEEE